jgi:hypothetical protein
VSNPFCLFYWYVLTKLDIYVFIRKHAQGILNCSSVSLLLFFLLHLLYALLFFHFSDIYNTFDLVNSLIRRISKVFAIWDNQIMGKVDQSLKRSLLCLSQVWIWSSKSHVVDFCVQRVQFSCVEIGGIDDHQCLYSLFIMYSLWKSKYGSYDFSPIYLFIL